MTITELKFLRNLSIFPSQLPIRLIEMNNIFYYLFLTILLFSCARKPLYNDPIPVHDSFTVESVKVEESRVITVWTPPGYQAGGESFPVLYMPDGGIREDFPHIANTLSQLIAAERIPPMILVGIENTKRGRDLTGFSEIEADEQYCPLTDGAKNFRAFITDELRPEINSRYRTTNESGIIGESLAGLFVMETFLTTPGTFDFYVAMDPSLWWNDHYLERKASEFLAELPDRPIRLWFAGSGAQDISIHTNNLANTIQNQQPDQLIWKYADEPTEKHSTIFRATKEKALVWVLTENEQK